MGQRGLGGLDAGLHQGELMRQLLREGTGQDLPPPADGGGRPRALQEVRPEGVQADRSSLYEESLVRPKRSGCVPFHRVRKGDIVRVHLLAKGWFSQQVGAQDFLAFAVSDPEVGKTATHIQLSSPDIPDCEVSDMVCEIEVIMSAQSAEEA